MAADLNSANLSSPLLDIHFSPDVILDVDGCFANRSNGDLSRPPYYDDDDDDDYDKDEEASTTSAAASAENPFEFLGATPLELQPISPIDPFRNHTPGFGGVYEWCKVVVCLPIAALRLALFGLALAVGYLTTVLAMYGWKDKQSPLPRWRRRVMWVTRICARLILFSFGYQWIKRIGRPAPREIAPIVVSNHVTYIEPIFFFFELFPTMVASESHDALPVVGTIIRAMQVIYVDRFSPQSRKQTVNEIKKKASLDGYQRIMMFPEGTTSNGRFILSFRLGAFIHGFPVQPVVVRYPYIHFDQSWGNISLLKLMLRMFTQFHNFMEVEYLPIIFPREGKQHNAVHFAHRTGYAMARALNVSQTSYSYGDMLLANKASELGKGESSNYLVEMQRIESLFDIRPSEAMAFLDRFLAMSPDSSYGRVFVHDFLTGYGLRFNPIMEKVFGYLDVEKKGSVTFRQFLTGSAHIRRQPSFSKICEAAFAKCNGINSGQISTTQFGNMIQSIVPIENDKMLCQLFDNNKDGIISKDDFMECLQKNPLLIALFTNFVNADDDMEET